MRGLAAIQHPSPPDGLHPPALPIPLISFNLPLCSTSHLCCVKSNPSTAFLIADEFISSDSWLQDANSSVLPGIAEGRT